MFTTDVNERDTVLATLENFTYEGIAYEAHPVQVENTVPLYRFFHTQTGNHFYTVSEQERLDIIETQSPPYNFEGIKWYVDRPSIFTEFTPPVDQALAFVQTPPEFDFEL